MVHIPRFDLLTPNPQPPTTMTTYNSRNGVIRFAPGDAVVTPIADRETVVSCDLHGCTLSNGARYAPERLTLSAITPDQIRSLSQIGYRVTGEDRKNVWLSGNGEDVLTTVAHLPKFIAEITN